MFKTLLRQSKLALIITIILTGIPLIAFAIVIIADVFAVLKIPTTPAAAGGDPQVKIVEEVVNLIAPNNASN